ncbi:MAG: Phage integrase, site-specific tyrosine recombinase (ACLAME 2) [uncultured Truepera sp.]|uniref:Phage integrase, site-specific tyrosine recombinase (ACLAME 2) n=1 Tax=uncultured Truepera sp. TaxID=543023 RepID=A0A6J4VK78_9DEIN|nr:MAG: Phage integrase, site-specific tyrosine recombinase (ACLAME 2) [uncultured Truepera sp.]
MARRRSTRRGRGEGSVFQRADGTWAGEVTTGYDEGGKQRRKTVYGKTQAEVLVKVAGVKQQLSLGTLSKSALTVKLYLEKWLAEKARTVKPRTQESYKYCAEKYLNPRLGRTKLDKLTPLQAQSALSEIADAHGARTSNLCRAVLFNAMKQAVRWRLLPYNPLEGVTRIKEQQREMTVWTADETLRFLSVAQTHRLYPLFYLAMATGLRCGELLGLQWGDLKGNVLHVRRTLLTRSGQPTYSTPKTERGVRRVALAEDVLSLLEAHRERVGSEHRQGVSPIFVSDAGTLLNARNVTRVWHALQVTAGVPKARLHDARHLHVSLLVKQGLDPRTIADRVGHTDPSFTLRKYSHMFEDQRQATAISLTDLLKPSAPRIAN